MYLVSYSCEILEATVTNDTSIVEYWLQITVLSIRQPYMIIGLNCEWGPHPISPTTSHKISIMQFCVGTKCLIFQLSHMNFNIPQSVKSFLSDSHNIFVGVGVEEIVSMLRNEYGICCENTLFDVRALAKKRFPFSFCGRPGLKTLAYQLVKLPMWKPKKVLLLSDFESLNLDKEQVKNACIDVYASYRIGHKLIKESNESVSGLLGVILTACYNYFLSN